MDASQTESRPRRRLRQFVVPLIAASVHLMLCLAIQFGAFGHEGSWPWFVAFLADFPFSIAFFPLQWLPPLLVFGTLGSAWWFLLAWLGVRIVMSFSGQRPTPEQS